MKIQHKLATILLGLTLFSGAVYASDDSSDSYEKRRRSGRYAPLTKFTIKMCKDPAIRWVFFNTIGVACMIGSQNYTNLINVKTLILCYN